MRPAAWYAVLCPKCGIDITGYTALEVQSHRQFDEHMEESPKSIPSQPVRPDEDWQWQDRSRRDTQTQYNGWGKF